VLTTIAEWTFAASAVLAIMLGVLVWPANIHALDGVHGAFGWLVVLMLWTLAALAFRSGARGIVWFSVVWGIVTAAGASAQYQLPAGSWATVLHVGTAFGAIACGWRLILRMRQSSDEACSPTEAIGIERAAKEFLAHKRIAITGVSEHPESHGSNIVHKRLRECGYDVFAVNPNHEAIGGERCYPNLKSIPGGVDAVVIGTRPEHAMATVRECADLGIGHVWMHRSIGGGSVSKEAAAWAHERGIRVIEGGCPLMFDPASDPAHKIMRPLLTLTGKVPRHV
jgi:predicted CoA-binding protein